MDTKWVIFFLTTARNFKQKLSDFSLCKVNIFLDSSLQFHINVNMPDA